MKTVTKTFLAAALIAAGVNASAQHVIKTVDFDQYTSPTNNDYVTWFSGGMGLEPQPTGGITGGALATPDSSSWGNGNARYCFKIKTEAWDSAAISISFLYDSTLVVPSSLNRAVSIWLNPSADWNQYLITSVTHNQRLEMIGYGWTNSPGVMLPLQHAHWYNLRVTPQFIPGFAGWMYNATAYVYDLGTDGMQTPVLIGTDNGSENNEIFPTDTAIAVSISGSRAGGAALLDNFYFDAKLSADSCEVDTTTNAVIDVQNASVAYTLNGTNLRVQTNLNDAVTITDAAGRVLHQAVADENKTDFDLSHQPVGIYLISVRTQDRVRTTRFLLRR